MAIPGKSCDEAAAAAFILDRLLAAGVPKAAIAHDNAHKQGPFGGQRGNLIVKLPGSPGRTKEPRRMLMAHIDTVPICVGCKPVKKGSVVRSADPTTGLGGDDRAGASAILIALLEILEHHLPHPPLTFLWCVQEEIGLIGARYVDVKKLGDPAPLAAFNFDGSKPADITIGATGAYRATIRIEGIPAHAGVHPEEGVSAITIASLAIADLHKNGWHGLIRKGEQRGTSNVGVYNAGQATNVITELAVLRAEMRSHDRKFRKRILDAFKAAFSTAAKQVKSSTGKRGKVGFDVSLDYDSFALKTDHPAVAIGAAAVSDVGLTPNLRISNGGLDANWMTDHGIPTVSFGCGQHDIHTAKEYLDLPEFFTGCEVALRLATGTEGDRLTR
jgi:tripeptide aminopeptidase